MERKLVLVTLIGISYHILAEAQKEKGFFSDEITDLDPTTWKEGKSEVSGTQIKARGKVWLVKETPTEIQAQINGSVTPAVKKAAAKKATKKTAKASTETK